MTDMKEKEKASPKEHEVLTVGEPSMMGCECELSDQQH
jgi:hypothetical protein